MKIFFILSEIVVNFCLNIISGIEISNDCKLRHNTQNCDFKIPKKPLYEKIRVFYSGVSIEECITKVENMRWSVGLYCENSLFCGLGMDLQTDYERPSQPEISPVTEVCDLLVNRQMISCETVLAALYDIKILRGEQSSSI